MNSTGSAISGDYAVCAKIQLMEVLIIRHGQSTNNALASDERLRVVDPPLTEIGQRQAALVAAHLADGVDRRSAPCETEPANGANGCEFGIKRLYASAMLRALQTAAPIGRALGLAPEVWVEIHEHGGMWLDHGAPTGVVGYPGMSRSEMAGRFPATRIPNGVTESGWYNPDWGFESLAKAWERAGLVAAQLRAWPDPDDRIALVTHGGFSSLLLGTLFGASPTARIFFHHDNTGITRVCFRKDGRVSLRYLNRVSHLPEELVT